MLPTTQIFTTKNEIKYLLFDTNDLITNEIKRIGVFEKFNIDICNTVLTYFLKNNLNGTVLDIGANIGTFTLPLAKKFPSINFISFEAQPVIFYQLCTNIILNSLDNVLAHNFAVTKENDVLEFNQPNYYTDRNFGNFSLISEYNTQRNRPNYSDTKKIKIKTTSIDDLGYDDVVFIKIDVEGMELSVLSGAENTIINNNYPSIICEAWNSKWFNQERNKIIDYLKSIGYDLIYIGDDILAQHQKNKFNIKI